MNDPPVRRSRFAGWEGWMGRVDMAGAAHLELVSGVVQLHPEDVMVEAMLSGWRAQQMARGLRECTIVPRERLVRRFLSFTSEDPWPWGAADVGEVAPSLARGKGPAPAGGAPRKAPGLLRAS